MSNLMYPLFGHPSPYFVVSNNFKEEIKKLISRFIKNKDQHREALSKLTTHPFIRYDSYLDFVEIYSKEQINHGKSLLLILIDLLKGDKLTINIPDSVHGDALITFEKLEKGHCTQFRVINSHTLLVKVDRHPYYGKKVLHQFYIFNKKEKSFTLLKSSYASHTFPRGEVSPSDEKLKSNYEKQLKKLLGRKSVKALNKIFKLLLFQSSILINYIPEDLNVEIIQLLGINLKEIILEEKQKMRIKFDSLNPNYINPHEKFGVSFDGMQLLLSKH